MKRHRRQLRVMDELNLTNLLDAAFVLLIAFMLVSPVIKHGLEVDLPPVAAATVETQQDFKPITIVIQAQDQEGFQDQIYIEDKRIDMDQLREAILAEKAANPDLVVLIDGDERSRHGTFTAVVATVQQCGVTKFTISTDPLQKN